MKKNKETYRPLPNFLTIKESGVDGLGLFATEEIEKNTILGVTHIRDSRFEDGYIRTPLGGFFNHSNNPNCEKFFDKDIIKIKTIKKIKPGEEILVTYKLYNPED